GAWPRASSPSSAPWADQSESALWEESSRRGSRSGWEAESKRRAASSRALAIREPRAPPASLRRFSGRRSRDLFCRSSRCSWASRPSTSSSPRASPRASGPPRRLSPGPQTPSSRRFCRREKESEMRFFRSLAAAAVLLLSSAVPVLARSDPAPTSNWQAEVDRVVRAVLASTGAPSASIAVVKDGRIAYVRAYGDAALQPRNPARPAMRYAIGSISKQFTAAAILLLAQDHKLSLDDPVGRFLPGLTRGDEVTVRQLLSHTSGYQDFWPQDYVPPFMLQDITAQAILDRWARKPLDFEPGTQYQYSNTGYTAAGLIVEKAGGVALMRLLRERVFGPLKMTSVFNVDESRLPESDPTGYIRYGLGPLRMAPKEGKGWLFAAGELAMTAEDIARWNISVIDQSLLAQASYAEMQTEVRLKNGLGIQYGLGLGVTSRSG